MAIIKTQIFFYFSRDSQNPRISTSLKWEFWKIPFWCTRGGTMVS